jgi:hypothetical protein
MLRIRTVIATLALVALSLGIHRLQNQGTISAQAGSGMQAAAQQAGDQGVGLYTQAAHILR